MTAPRDSSRRGGTIAFDVPNAYGVAQALLANDVIVDYRPNAGIRVAPHFYTSDDELERVVDMIDGDSARWKLETVRGETRDRDMKRIGLVLALCAATNVAHAQMAQPFARADTSNLRRSLDAIAAAHHGVLGYSILNLDTGERLSLRGDETFSTASLIKVPILVTLYDLVDKKQLSLDDPFTVLKIDQVPGSGVLQFMHPGMSLSVHDAASLMIILSDNTATNLVLDRIAIRRVWQKMEALGLAAHESALEDLSAPDQRGDGQLGEVRAGREHAERDGAPVRAAGAGQGSESRGGFVDAGDSGQQRRRRA